MALEAVIMIYVLFYLLDTLYTANQSTSNTRDLSSNIKLKRQ